MLQSHWSIASIFEAWTCSLVAFDCFTDRGRVCNHSQSVQTDFDELVTSTMCSWLPNVKIFNAMQSSVFQVTRMSPSSFTLV